MVVNKAFVIAVTDTLVKRYQEQELGNLKLELRLDIYSLSWDLHEEPLRLVKMK